MLEYMFEELEWFLKTICVFAAIGVIALVCGAVWILWRVIAAIL